MRRKTTLKSSLAAFITLLLFGSGSGSAQSGPANLVARWSFDEAGGTTARESVSNAQGAISGQYKRVDGVSGKALRFDGYTTSVVSKTGSDFKMPQAFSVEAWVAVAAYPWNWLPVVEQVKEDQAGFSLGIDAFGHFGMKLVVDGGWHTLLSTAQLPLRKWAHVTATFDPNQGVTLYLDGKSAAQLAVKGKFDAAPLQEFRIGRVAQPTLPAEWIHPKYAVWYSLDGVLDDVSIYNQALSPSAVAEDFDKAHATTDYVLPLPVLPSGPPGKGRFGAYYTHLQYEDSWDAPRRVGPDSDVVVRFDQSPIRLVFWQGTNYIASWVTENGKWYTDEFLETGGPEDCPGGEDCEPMSDKQNRYSHVRVLQSNEARAVVHWRYALTEAEHYGLANVDPYTGWSDWADEYYTVYPDGCAVRKQVLWTSNFRKWHEFQETIVINSPGTRPEDNISDKALTLANMQGETFTYTWPLSEKTLTQPANPNIQIVNLKSEWKPFQIVNPFKSRMTAYTGEKTYSLFEWWNHWPVAQVASSGVSAVAPDRASHSSLSHIYWEPYAQTSDSMTKIMLHGLTNGRPAELVALARSWVAPAQATVQAGGFSSEGYDPTQRAFIFVSNRGASPNLSFSLAASGNSPVVDPAIVVRNWGRGEAAIRVNGRPISWSSTARRGYEDTLEGTNLVVWLKIDADKPINVEINRAAAR